MTAKGTSDSVHLVLKTDEKIRDEAEENRLLYVAMTRAEQRLILSYTRRKQPSPWQKLVEAAIPQVAVMELLSGTDSADRGGSFVVPATELLGLPRVTGQYDSSASVTSVAMFHAHPRRYYLERYLGLDPETTGPGTGAIEFGLAVHRALSGEAVDSPEAAALAASFATTGLGRRAASAYPYRTRIRLYV